MRFLIAGGSGMIGTALTHRLLADGHSVTILSRDPAAHSVPKGASLVPWDGETPDGWGHLLNDTDAVVNLSGANIGGALWTKKRREQLISSRLNSGKALVDAFQAAQQKPEVLLQSSAVGYYHPAGNAILEESSPPGTSFQGALCQRWEETTRAVESMGVRRVVTRSAPVLALGELILTMFLLPFRMFVGGPIGGGRQYLSWIHIQDEVEGLVYLLANKSCVGTYNLMSPQPVTNAEFGHVIGRVLKRPYWFPVPAFALKLVLGEMSSVVLDSWRGVPTRLSAAGFKFKFADPEAALRNLLGR